MQIGILSHTHMSGAEVLPIIARLSFELSLKLRGFGGFPCFRIKYRLVQKLIFRNNLQQGEKKAIAPFFVVVCFTFLGEFNSELLMCLYLCSISNNFHHQFFPD